MLLKSMMLTNMSILPMMNHPISMGTIMIIQTMLMCSIHSKISNSSWFCYILFLTIIGGLMIMFMYMASIASNEKFKPNMKIVLMWMTIFMIMIMLMKSNMLTKINEQKLNMMKIEHMKSTMKFFNKPKYIITMLMMIIMLTTMISVTFISNSFEGPLKMT
uniref:NADH dehydrogenase subunit 6 n=1 Tax=Raivuna sinica TaxID=2992948 RepID=UPI002551DF35|nr:NADH dehydrogenase subunit 6 [Raivuna sinica]WGG26908.1 NADH dehydrogenase subunit 6 [Raivuna sinica]